MRNHIDPDDLVIVRETTISRWSVVKDHDHKSYISEQNVRDLGFASVADFCRIAYHDDPKFDTHTGGTRWIAWKVKGAPLRRLQCDVVKGQYKKTVGEPEIVHFQMKPSGCLYESQRKELMCLRESFEDVTMGITAEGHIIFFLPHLRFISKIGMKTSVMRLQELHDPFVNLSARRPQPLRPPKLPHRGPERRDYKEQMSTDSLRFWLIRVMAEKMGAVAIDSEGD